MNTSRFFDIVLSITTIALVTTLILPGRQTAPVIRAASSGGSEFLGTAMGTRRR